MAEGPAGAPAAPPAENLPEFKAPTVTPPAPIQGADAAYNEQVGKIEFQLGNQLSGDRQTFEDTRKTYEYNKALLPAKEYEQTGRLRFKEALGVAPNSGVVARAGAQQQAKFLDTRTKMAMAYEKAQQGVNTRAGEQVGARGQKLKEAGTNAENVFKRGEVKNAPQEPITVAGGGPPGSRVTAGPGSPGKPLQFGFKEVEQREAREAAARKARKR